MKKFLPIILMVLSIFSASAQIDSTSVFVTQIGLKIGQEFDNGDYKVILKKVISDSRCPKNVTCIWAGTAEVLIELKKGGISCREYLLEIGSSVDLNLNNLPQLSNINLKVKSLSPYPETPIKIKEEDYRLLLQISETIN
ncbi:hypothetical protein [Zunongwangia sp. HGR-M22]|uniref:hypothetical protein n=1 Tax=Zunongwangia sp. HGR-M22 TaxID=3015168 RepID=UPI0022DE45B0|nr:hypothetical protein [Zunongwangia sp. HGR-M22]WBL25573.1 hypothetical protein PBT91_16970 [Zunongwangia sp. HGR-M22]